LLTPPPEDRSVATNTMRFAVTSHPEAVAPRPSPMRPPDAIARVLLPPNRANRPRC
jgi:hypothetical protein